jgi:hypothetical protein
MMQINLIQDSLSFHLTEPYSLTLENLTSLQTNLRKINIVVSADNNRDLQIYLHLLLNLLKNSPNVISLSLDLRIKISDLKYPELQKFGDDLCFLFPKLK